MQSTEDFDSTSSIPVFGSAVTQTKLQQQQQTFNNESGGMEKLVTPPQPVANGESDASSAKKTDDHVGNGTVESHHGKTNGNGDANDGHVNGKHDQPEAGTIPPAESNAQGNGHHVEEATSKPIEKTSDHDAPAVLSSDSAVTATPTAPSTIDPVVVAEPEPSSSTPAETADVPAEPSTVAASQPSAVAEVGTPERPSQVSPLQNLSLVLLFIFLSLLVANANHLRSPLHQRVNRHVGERQLHQRPRTTTTTMTPVCRQLTSTNLHPQPNDRNVKP